MRSLKVASCLPPQQIAQLASARTIDKLTVNDPAPVLVTLDVLKDERMTTVPPVEPKLTQDFAEPIIGFVAEVLFVPSLRVVITSVPGMVFFQRNIATFIEGNA